MHAKSPVEIIYSHKQCPRKSFSFATLATGPVLFFLYNPVLEQVSIHTTTLLTKPAETYTLGMDELEVLVCGPTFKPIPNVPRMAGRIWQPSRDPFQPYWFVETQWCCSDVAFGPRSQNKTPTTAPQWNQGPRPSRSRRYQLPHTPCSWMPTEGSPTAGIQPRPQCQ